jgi:large subunit ribosomal protein L25
MKRIKLPAEIRNLTGKGPARRLRAAGKVPAIFYGKKNDPIMLAVDVHTFTKAITHTPGSNLLLDLEIKNNGETLTKAAILKESQVRPVDGTFLHLDLLEVFKDVPLDVTVTLEFDGKVPGVEAGGVFQTVARELPVSCLPDDIPDSITVDVSGLEIGDSIHAKDITLPKGVTITADETLTLATVTPPVQLVEETEEEAEGELPPEEGTEEGTEDESSEG